MVNYGDGKIYKIEVDEELYVGSTAQKYLCTRLAGHKNSSKTDNMRLYTIVNDRAQKWEGVNIVLLEKYPCSTKDELYSRERYWIEKLKPSLNSALPIKTTEEIKETKSRNAKRYYNNNKEVVQERARQYREQNKELIKAKDRSPSKCTVCEKEMNHGSVKRHMKKFHTNDVREA